MFEHATPAQISQIPTVGSIVIWRRKGTRHGHAGIVIAVMDNGDFITIEGNTSDGSGINRDGDGVFEKTRTRDGFGTMQLLGFLRPWE